MNNLLKTATSTLDWIGFVWWYVSLVAIAYFSLMGLPTTQQPVTDQSQDLTLIRIVPVIATQR